MAFIGTGFIDPKDYPYKKYIDEQNHLDCDEHRDKMVTVTVRVEDQAGEEHLFCDKSQLDAEGKFRRPKKLIEAERRGFKGVAEMDQADQAAKEERAAKVIEDQRRTIYTQAGYIDTLSVRSKGLEDHARQLEKDLQDYKALTEARFDKLAKLISK